jgi:hypothetical protein
MSSNIQGKLSKLFYGSGDKWNHLPSWAVFYLELGIAISEYPQKGPHFILGISVPTRAYAASLISAGIIAARIGMQCNVDDRINKIVTLPIDTALIYRSNNKCFKAYYKGAVEKMGEKYFALKTAKGTEIFVSYEKVNQIEIAGNKQFKLGNTHKGISLPKPSLILEYLLCQQDLEKLLVESRLECVLLSQLNTIIEEINMTTLSYCCNENEFIEGTIQDLIRPKNSNSSYKHSYRSYIFPASGKYSLQFSLKYSPHVTVFDNALAFIKWRSSWRHSNWVVVLDRTDRNFEYAINLFNDEYKSPNRFARKFKLPIPKPPKGVELMVFEVAG